MIEINNIFKLARIAVFATTSFFALIVIILSGLVTNFTDIFLGGFVSFAALGIATGLLTLLTLPVMLALSIVRKGAFTSMIAVEIGWTWFLWILWLAVGGNSASGIVFVGDCGRYAIDGPRYVTACNENQAITAFGFLSWIMLMSYCALLGALTFRQHLRGNTGIWTKDVIETDFTAVGANNTQSIFDSKASATYPNQYPPAGTPIVPQQTAGSYTPAGVPYQAATGSPYPQPQAPSLYTQPQANTGSFTQPQAQTGTSPYPQV